MKGAKDTAYLYASPHCHRVTFKSDPRKNVARGRRNFLNLSKLTVVHLVIVVRTENFQACYYYFWLLLLITIFACAKCNSAPRCTLVRKILVAYRLAVFSISCSFIQNFRLEMGTCLTLSTDFVSRTA